VKLPKFPGWLRFLIYAVNVLGSPVVAYLLAKGVIGATEVALWSGEVAAAFLLAGLNVQGSIPSIHDDPEA
jgi:hypothetical protein